MTRFHRKPNTVNKAAIALRTAQLDYRQSPSSYTVEALRAAQDNFDKIIAKTRLEDPLGEEWTSRFEQGSKQCHSTQKI